MESRIAKARKTPAAKAIKAALARTTAKPSRAQRVVKAIHDARTVTARENYYKRNGGY